jgi:hypothetical protein
MHEINLDEINLLEILDTDRAGVTKAMAAALAALQDGNTVNAEALTERFIAAFAQHSPWVRAGDFGIRG